LGAYEKRNEGIIMAQRNRRENKISTKLTRIDQFMITDSIIVENRFSDVTDYTIKIHREQSNQKRFSKYNIVSYNMVE
jgi:hypothetical protein